jgi:ubiquitin C-terminal hydrolase
MSNHPPCAGCSKLNAASLRDALRDRKGGIGAGKPCTLCREEAHVLSTQSINKGLAKGGAKKKDGRKVDVPSAIVEDAMMLCLTCVAASCVTHAISHYEACNKKNKRDQKDVPAEHCVFVNLVSMLGHCFHCSLEVGSGAPEDDCWAENRGAVAVNAAGYCIDYEDYFGEPTAVVLAAVANPSSLAENCAEPTKRKGKGGKTRQPTGASGTATVDKEARRQAMRESGLYGLQNMGNTCFFNATVQCLLQATPLVERCWRIVSSELGPECGVGSFTKSLAQLVHGVARREYAGSVITPNGLFQHLVRRNSMFREMGQQDAQELFNCLANGVDDEYAALRKREGGATAAPRQGTDTDGTTEPPAAEWTGSLAAATVGGSLVNTVKCDECGNASSRCDRFFCVSVPVTTSIRAGLATFMTEEAMTGSDAYACEHCHRDVFEAEQRRRAAEERARSERAAEFAAEAAPASADAAEVTVEAGDDDTSDDDDDDDDDQDGVDSDDNDERGVSHDAAAAETAEPTQARTSLSPQSPASPAPGATAAASPASSVARDATLTHAFRGLKDIFVIHVNRFQVNMRTYTYEKCDDFVIVDPVIDVTPYLDTTERAAAPNASYRLIGVVEHQGKIDHGHYVAYVLSRTTGVWFYCSDSDVTATSWDRVSRAQAYLAFYQSNAVAAVTYAQTTVGGRKPDASRCNRFAIARDITSTFSSLPYSFCTSGTLYRRPRTRSENAAKAQS